MTYQDAMLKLARAVYPDNDPQTYQGLSNVVYWKWRANPSDGHYTVWSFDPANNDSQAVAVELWLLNKDANNSISKGCILYVATDATGWAKRAEYFHDPASFRAAVTKAALQVAS